MILNFTLVIQALNFGIAFWLLRTFIFKPIVADIMVAEQQESDYRGRVAAFEYEVEQARQNLSHEHMAMKQTLKVTYPKKQPLQQFSFDEIQLDEKKIKPTEQEKIELSKKFIDALYSKVMI